MKRTVIEITEELNQTRERLDAYLSMEAQILSGKGVREYQIGTRRLEKFDLSLKDIQNAIKELRKRIEELENELAGGTRRRAVAVIPRDW